MTKFGLEITNAVIIGDTHTTGQLFHEGRAQGPRFIGSTDAEVRAQAQEYVDHLKAAYGREYKRLYPNGMELRIWD